MVEVKVPQSYYSGDHHEDVVPGVHIPQRLRPMLNPEADNQRNNDEDGYCQNGLPLLGHALTLPFIEIVLLLTLLLLGKV